jgi:putative glutamine amidotransferase
MRPLIGMTTSRYTNQHGWRYVKGYVANAEAVVKAGGLPVFIPVSMPDEVIRGIYERLDGILLPGGVDVDPDRYGKTKHELTVGVDLELDHLEINLARWAVEDDLPTLGICRGHQVLNVALGGKLIQDIGTEVNTDIRHDVPHHLPRRDIAHTVEVMPESKLAAALGQTTVSVNSLHHQAVKVASDRVQVTARAADGVIEGVEMPDRTFILSVQWHPEDIVGHEETADCLFAAFVEAARTRMVTGKAMLP